MAAHEHKLIDQLSIWIGQIFSYVFLISIAIMVYEVVVRYVFNAPTIWVQDATTTLTAVGFALGGAYTMQRRGHISITIVYSQFPDRVQALIDVFVQFVILVFLGALIYGAAINAEKAWAVMETSGSAWNQPTPVVLKTVLLVGAIMMLLQACVHLMQAFSRLFDGDNQ